MTAPSMEKMWVPAPPAPLARYLRRAIPLSLCSNHLSSAISFLESCSNHSQPSLSDLSWVATRAYHDSEEMSVKKWPKRLEHRSCIFVAMIASVVGSSISWYKCYAAPYLPQCVENCTGQICIRFAVDTDQS